MNIHYNYTSIKIQLSNAQRKKILTRNKIVKIFFSYFLRGWIKGFVGIIKICRLSNIQEKKRRILIVEIMYFCLFDLVGILKIGRLSGGDRDSVVETCQIYYIDFLNRLLKVFLSFSICFIFLFSRYKTYRPSASFLIL